MKKSTFQSSNKSGNARLKDAFKSSSDLAGDIADADILADIATQLYRLRKTAGIRQKDLAAELKVQQSNISRYETPGYTGYTIKMLLRYVRKLNGKLNISISPPTSDYYAYVTIVPVRTEVQPLDFLNDDGSITTKDIQITSELKHTVSITNAVNGVTQYGQFKTIK